jgi:peroxiredoxin Q/BCP
MKEVKVGDQMPVFSLKNQNNELIDSQSWLGAPVVVYFYPKNNTPVCTAEACSFRNNYSEFEDLNVKVVGISNDSVSSHLAFAKKHNLPFTLLSDEKDEASKLFGVPKGLMGLSPGRVTYVFDKNGVLIYMHNATLRAKAHVEAALKSLK